MEKIVSRVFGFGYINDLLEPDTLKYCKHKNKYCGRLKNKQGLTLPVLCPREALYTKAEKIQNFVIRVTK